MASPNDTPIPDGFKRCTNKNCQNPEGRILPKTSEYFGPSKSCATTGMQSWCRDCMRAYSREWQKRNRDRVNENQKRWVSNPENREKKRQDYRDRYQNNRDVELERHRLYKEKHPERRKKAEQKYRDNHPRRVKISKERWKVDNPEKLRLYDQRRKNRRKNLPITLKVKDWKHALRYWSNSCAYCGQEATEDCKLQQEHFVPMSSGGGYTPENILPSCPTCNYSKRDTPADEWLMSTRDKESAQAILERIAEYFRHVGKR